MSLPQIPAEFTNLTRDDAINLILLSIAMEEIGLSHILNAEGEKIQYVLGTLHDKSPPEPVTVEDVLKVNNSVEKTLDAATRKQKLLLQKMTEALNASTMPGPPGPPGPKGDPGIEIKPITEEGYLALSDDEKKNPEILWIIYPENF